MAKRQVRKYNDGVVKFYRKLTDKNVKSMDDLEYLGKLRFEERSIRNSDVEYALQHDKKLSLKISTPDDGNMDTTRIAIVENIVYAIIHIDRDREKKELYFYLQEVRTL